MAISFDGPGKLITLGAGTTLSVRGLWSEWALWAATSDNSKYAMAMTNLGGDSIDAAAGTAVPIYLFLMNGWRIRPQESNHTLNVTEGILLVSGGGEPFISTLGSFNVRINYSQPVQAITVNTAGGGSVTVDITAIADAVWSKILTGQQTAGSAGSMIQDSSTRISGAL